jgi:hypothetical protein
MDRRVWVRGRFISSMVMTILLALAGCSHTQTRGQAADEVEKEEPDIKNVQVIGDLTEVGNFNRQPVSGVGLVCGLRGTGGGVPDGEFKKWLQDKLYNEGVTNVQEIFASPNYTLVLVNAIIPVGARRGDSLDVEVSLLPQSKATSLRGGYLRECELMDYDVKRGPKGGEQLLKGHVLAKAKGPLLVDFGEGSEEVRLRRGRIWGGGLSLIDSPLYLYLKNDSKSARAANAIATKINLAFPDDARKQNQMLMHKRLQLQEEVANGINDKFRGPSSTGMGRGEVSHAFKEFVTVNVPLEYRLNNERYLRVIRMIPLHETPDTAGRYRNRLDEMLLEPKDTVRAALRLEALGKESVPALKKGLNSQQALVRFTSAEALAYLGSTAGIDELGRLATQYEALRGHCLTAMAGLNEAASQMKLTELMNSSVPELRVGAFRALLAMNEGSPTSASSPGIHSALVNDDFWLHHVREMASAGRQSGDVELASAGLASPGRKSGGNGESLIHISTNGRAEIVIFGDSPALTPPLKLYVEPDFVISAERDDLRCTISRSVLKPPSRQQKQCSFKVEEILQTMASMGGQYSDAVEFLRSAQRVKCLTCPLAVDALPSATPLELLAACGSDAARFKSQPEFQQEVQTLQHELGMEGGKQEKKAGR